MPLKPGPSSANVASNISELMSTGRPHNQAVVIAMKTAGKGKPKPKFKGKR